MKLEKLPGADPNHKCWFAVDYTDKRKAMVGVENGKPKYADGYTSYAVLNPRRKAIELDDRYQGKEFMVIIDEDGYAQVPALMNEIYS